MEIPEYVKNALKTKGQSFRGWCRCHNFNVELARQVLFRYSKAGKVPRSGDSLTIFQQLIYEFGTGP